MNIYFVGGEDIDFNASAAAPVVDTTSGRFRSGWARCSVRANSSTAVLKSNAFLAGAQTSCWLGFQMWTNGSAGTSNRVIALVSSATASSGLWLGTGNATSSKVGLYKFDGTTMTSLAQSTADVMNINGMQRFDVQLTSFGASATVNVFVNGTSIISFTGDVTVTGVTNIDCVGITGNTVFGISEVVVADSDTRSLQGVQVLALTGAGTTNNWTNNTFTNINGISFSDTNPTSVNTTGTNQQYNVTDPTATTFSVIAVKQSARMAKSATSTPTAVKLGVNSGGTVAFGTGASKTLTTSYATYEQIDATNPATGVAFTSSELTALQLNMQSA